jgi:hypothetical protein
MQRAPALAAFSRSVFPNMAQLKMPKIPRKAPAAGNNNAVRTIIAIVVSSSPGRDLVVAACAA